MNAQAIELAEATPKLAELLEKIRFLKVAIEDKLKEDYSRPVNIVGDINTLLKETKSKGGAGGKSKKKK